MVHIWQLMLDQISFFAICLLARYSTEKTFNACKALVHVFSYLETIIDEGIRYHKRSGVVLEDMLDLHSYCDADWAGDLRTRCSTGGYVVFGMGEPLAWSSKVMTTVAASNMKSEYMSAYPCGQEVIFIRNLFGGIWFYFFSETNSILDG